MARKSAKPPESPDSPASKVAPKARKKAATPAKSARAKVEGPRKARTTTATTFAPVPGAKSGRSLVIVESPKKAKSINKFLGPNFVVKASMGHVRDLPKRTLGLDVTHGYEPSYEIMAAKKDTIGELKQRGRQGRHGLPRHRPRPRRGGDRLAPPGGPRPARRARPPRDVLRDHRARRQGGVQHVAPIDMDKVNAQQARRFLDRFVGYQLSPLLWKKVARNLSAGRVQSVAVRLIAEREKEIRAFVSEEYWRITATLAPKRLGRRGRPLRRRAGRVEGRQVRGEDRGGRAGHPRRPRLGRRSSSRRSSRSRSSTRPTPPSRRARSSSRRPSACGSRARRP